MPPLDVRHQREHARAILTKVVVDAATMINPEEVLEAVDDVAARGAAAGCLDVDSGGVSARVGTRLARSTEQPACSLDADFPLVAACNFRIPRLALGDGRHAARYNLPGSGENSEQKHRAWGSRERRCVRSTPPSASARIASS